MRREISVIEQHGNATLTGSSPIEEQSLSPSWFHSKFNDMVSRVISPTIFFISYGAEETEKTFRCTIHGNSSASTVA